MSRPSRWTKERANAWYARQPWLRGCNFIPSNAINQLAMWQADSFDPETIDRELGWAADLGFNAMRVYLHDLLWLEDAGGLKTRINQYLDISARHGISTMFVLFDDCWHDDPKSGTQPDPIPGVHNSGWLKSPGTKMIKNQAAWGRLEDYVSDIVSTFGADKRVVVWDIYNEPGNNFLVALGKSKLAGALSVAGQLLKYLLFPIPTVPLLKAAFGWARTAGPAQPLTVGLWYLRDYLPSKLNNLSLALSDIISFHSYSDLKATSQMVSDLKTHGRPLFCTEYLARTAGSQFETILPFYKENQVGCFNWGLVSGKTQTMYAWDTVIENGAEPDLWFHDILRPDGSPYKSAESDLIRSLTAD